MKTKRLKIFLLHSAVAFSALSVAAVVSCEIKTDDKLEKENVEEELNNLEIGAEVKNSNSFSKPLPENITEDSLDIKGTFPQGVKYKILGIVDRDNKTGTAKVNVELTKNGVKVQKLIEIKGLSLNPFGTDELLNRKTPPIELDKYVNSNPLQRFDVDNKVYVSNHNLKSVIEIYETEIKEYEDKAKDLENNRQRYKDSKIKAEKLNALDVKNDSQVKELKELTDFIELFNNVKKELSDTKAKYEEQKADLEFRKSQTQKLLKDAEIFDKKAGLFNQDTYDNASRKRFTLPEYDENGKFIGLKPHEGAEVGKGPSWLDNEADKGGNRIPVGLARTLPNDFYKKIGLQTFSIDMSNTNEKNNHVDGAAGTIWIMDYQPTSDGSYPTKWYFGTNAHVSNYLKTMNDPNYPTRTDNSELTTRIMLTRLTDRTPTKSTLRTLESDTTFDRWVFGLNRNQDAFKTIYSAYNYLKTSPKDYLVPNSAYKNSEEFMDFSVIEIDFSKINSTHVPVYSAGENKGITYPTPIDLAKALTDGYADKKEDHIKFASTSYLKDYSKIQWPILNNDLDPLHRKNKGKWVYDGLFALGYPRADEDGFLDKYADADQLKNRKFFPTLWVNGKGGWYNKLGIDENTGKGFISEEELNRGNTVSSTIGFRSFKDKPGITDLFIASAVTGNGIFKYEIKNDKDKKGSKLIDDFEVDPKVSEDFDNTYLHSGLHYVLRHFAPFGGSSGSSVRNQKNEIVGALYHKNDSARASLILALRSEGFDYEGLYGNYNLEQYDLIYGGGKNQRTSYRQALAHLYGKNFKTNLFPQGLDETKIPDEFKFNEKYLTAADTVNEFPDVPKTSETN